MAPADYPRAPLATVLVSTGKSPQDVLLVLVAIILLFGAAIYTLVLVVD
jgi:hypothetical protein